jgi:hypothetical protein
VLNDTATYSCSPEVAQASAALRVSLEKYARALLEKPSKWLFPRYATACAFACLPHMQGGVTPS